MPAVLRREEEPENHTEGAATSDLLLFGTVDTGQMDRRRPIAPPDTQAYGCKNDGFLTGAQMSSMGVLVSEELILKEPWMLDKWIEDVQ
uniref:Uncharacterized protein n=1 Tax=Steinernema glaseri TaxID=37863 RepID=A0A1I7YC07_9BILA